MARKESEARRTQRKAVQWSQEGGHPDPACGVDGDTMRRADPRIVFFNKDFRPAKKMVEKRMRRKSQERNKNWSGAAGLVGGNIKQVGSVRPELYCRHAGSDFPAGTQKRLTVQPEQAEKMAVVRHGSDCEVTNAAGLPNVLDHYAKAVWCNVFEDAKERKAAFRQRETKDRAPISGKNWVKRYQPPPRSAAGARLAEGQLAETRLGPHRSASEAARITEAGLDTKKKNRNTTTFTKKKLQATESSPEIVSAGIRRTFQPSMRTMGYNEQLGPYRERLELYDAGNAGLNCCRVNRDVATFNAQIVDNLRQKRKVDIDAARTASDSLVNAMPLPRHGDWIYSHDIGRNRPGVSTTRKWKGRCPAVPPTEQLAVKRLAERAKHDANQAKVKEDLVKQMQARLVAAQKAAGQRLIRHQMDAANG
jgi:hypothetical protein